MPVLNAFRLNEGLLNGDGSGTTRYPTDVVVFDGFSLSDGTNLILNRIGDPEPAKEIIAGPIPRGDGSYAIANYLRDKIIPVQCYLKQSTAAAFDQYIDTIKKGLRGFQKNLDITRKSDGAVRRFVATLANGEEIFADRQSWNVTVQAVTFKFVCKDGLGYDRGYSSTGVTSNSSPASDLPVNAGTYSALPIFVLVVNSASSITAVNITNTTTGEQIEYDGSLAAGDVLLIDGEQKKVTKNGTAVLYSGSFPTLDVGSNTLSYTITGSGFSVRATCKWRNRYL